jgi:hypothetical protein
MYFHLTQSSLCSKLFNFTLFNQLEEHKLYRAQNSVKIYLACTFNYMHQMKQ